MKIHRNNKVYISRNVYDETLRRIKYCFKKFDNVLVAFSAGKDSGVVLNLAYDYAKKTNQLDKLAIYHMDYEADYEESNNFVKRVFSDEYFKGIKKYWLCLPISAQCAVSMHQIYWIPWDDADKSIWVKQMPDNRHVINQENCPFEFKKGTYGATVRKDFSKWFSKKYGKTAVFVGIRCDESLNRLAILTSRMRVNTFKNRNWTNKLDDMTYVVYPIYDWGVDDIWIANAKFSWDYNKVYDLMYYSGLSPNEMRVASPFHSCAVINLSLYRALSPNTWGKMVSRVNGVNFSNIYGGTTAMGWKNITKPKHFTWKEYAEFLLKTLPNNIREKYEVKIKKSQWHWRVQGGARDEDFISRLENEGAKIRRTGKGSNSCKVNIDKELIYIDEMVDDTNVKEFRKAPSWKRVCIAILKNDVHCLYMGFSRNKEQMQKRKIAIEKYRSI